MFFKDIPLFAGLSAADHTLLLQVAERRRYPRHTMMMQEGDPGEHFYLLRQGRAKIYLSNREGREIILSLLGPGDFFGEMALIDSEPCSANVMTLEECEFVSIRMTEFQQILASSPDMAMGLMKVLSRHLREADQQIESLALNDVKARVEQVLRSLAEPEDGELVIPPRITHREIAAMVGTSREVVTRIFRNLEERGTVRVEGRRITVSPIVAAMP